MATVYSVLISFEKDHWFKFNDYGITVVGIMVANKWREQGGTTDKLDVVQSIERSGHTYMVFDYPQSFVPEIVTTIKTYISNCSKKKTIAEKPGPAPIPISSPLPPQKKLRKRIPIKPPSEPAYTGSKFLKK